MFHVSGESHHNGYSRLAPGAFAWSEAECFSASLRTKARRRGSRIDRTTADRTASGDRRSQRVDATGRAVVRQGPAEKAIGSARVERAAQVTRRRCCLAPTARPFLQCRSLGAALSDEDSSSSVTGEQQGGTA